MANGLATLGGGEKRCALAHRRAALGAQAHSGARRTLLQFAQNTLCAGKPARTCPVRAAHLLDRPSEGGFHRCGRHIDVVAIKAVTGFEAKRVPRAETDCLNLLVGCAVWHDCRRLAMLVAMMLIALLVGGGTAKDKRSKQPSPNDSNSDEKKANAS